MAAAWPLHTLLPHRRFFIHSVQLDDTSTSLWLMAFQASAVAIGASGHALAAPTGEVNANLKSCGTFSPLASSHNHCHRVPGPFSYKLAGRSRARGMARFQHQGKSARLISILQPPTRHKLWKLHRHSTECAFHLFGGAQLAHLITPS